MGTALECLAKVEYEEVMSFSLLPARIDDHWSNIVPVLLRHFAGDPARILAACEKGEAVLLLAPEGFVIAAEEEDSDTGEIALCVWFAWGEGEDLIEKYQDEFCVMAKGLGFTSVTLHTSIDGIERKLAPLGWKRGPVEYRLEIG